MAFRAEIRPLEVDEYQFLRNSTTWDSLAHSVVEKALKKDLFSVCILKDNEPIGIGRVVGDGAIYFYVQDVIVLPEYQGQGIGRMIMEYIEQYLTKTAHHNSFIGLMAAEGTQPFYHRFGYRARSENAPGMFKKIKK